MVKQLIFIVGIPIEKEVNGGYNYEELCALGSYEKYFIARLCERKNNEKLVFKFTELDDFFNFLNSQTLDTSLNYYFPLY